MHEDLIKRLREIADSGTEITDKRGAVLGYAVHWGNASDAMIEAATALARVSAERDRYKSQIDVANYVVRAATKERDKALEELARLKSAQLTGEAEPVAWRVKDEDGEWCVTSSKETAEECERLFSNPIHPLYAAAPQSQDPAEQIAENAKCSQVPAEEDEVEALHDYCLEQAARERAMKGISGIDAEVAYSDLADRLARAIISRAPKAGEG